MKPTLNGLHEPIVAQHWAFDDLWTERLGSGPAGTSDLRMHSGPRHDQRNTPSCVGQAYTTAAEVLLSIRDDVRTELSTMACYYLAREAVEGRVPQYNAGTHMWAGAEAMHRFGAIRDVDHPWNPERIDDSPSWPAMQRAIGFRLKPTDPGWNYYGLQQRATIVDGAIKALSCGLPVVIGCRVGAPWYQYCAGDVLGPVPDEIVDGRHATCLLGWDGHAFIGENSWGNWGDGGFYRLAPEVLEAEGTEAFVLTPPPS